MMRILPSTLGARLRLLLLCGLLVAVSVVGKIQVLPYYLAYSPREGDVIFQSLPHMDLVDAIEGVTRSPFSHCGVVLRENGRWVVIEAIGDVHETPLLRWMQRGRGAGFATCRVAPQFESSIPAFKECLLAYRGKPYDYDYEMSDDAIYCSELVFKAFQAASGERLGTLEPLGNLNWRPFGSFISSMNGSVTPPLDRLIITPVSLSKAAQFREVCRHGI